jgi:hypothetical protein
MRHDSLAQGPRAKLGLHNTTLHNQLQARHGPGPAGHTGIDRHEHMQLLSSPTLLAGVLLPQTETVAANSCCQTCALSRLLLFHPGACCVAHCTGLVLHCCGCTGACCVAHCTGLVLHCCGCIRYSHWRTFSCVPHIVHWQHHYKFCNQM